MKLILGKKLNFQFVSWLRTNFNGYHVVVPQRITAVPPFSPRYGTTCALHTACWDMKSKQGLSKMAFLC